MFRHGSVCHFGLSFPKCGEPSMRLSFRSHSSFSAISIPVTVSHRLIGILLPVLGSMAIANSSPSLNWALAIKKVVFGNSSQFGNLLPVLGGKWSDLCLMVLKNSAPSGEPTHGSSVSFCLSFSESGLLFAFNVLITSVRVLNSFPSSVLIEAFFKRFVLITVEMMSTSRFCIMHEESDSME